MTKPLNFITLLLLIFFINKTYANTPLFDRWGNVVFDSNGNRSEYFTPNVDYYQNMDDQALFIPTDQSALFPEWFWADLGTGIGLGILDSADFNGDGNKQLITTGGGAGFSTPNTLFILEKDLSSVNCVAHLDFLPFDYYIKQMDDDQALEIVLVTEDDIFIMDGETCHLQQYHHFENNITAAGIGDVNNDDILDIVYSHNNNLYVAAMNDLSNPLERIGFGGSKIVVNSLGREDGDDIGVLSNVTYILKGNDLTTITEIHDNLTPMFDFADINGDQSYEIVQVARWTNGITVTNIDNGNILFNMPIFNVAVMRIMDIDDDNNHEIIIGDAQWGNVYVVDETANVINTINNPSHGTTNVLITSLENNGDVEFIWGAGHSSTGADFLYRGNIVSETITWQSTDIDGPFQVGQLGDVFGNGQDYITVSYAESNSGYDIGGVALLNADSGIQQPIVYTTVQAPWGTVTSVASANIDDDESWEVCFTGDNTYDEFITCRDATTEEIQWTIDVPNGYVYQIEIMDINNDSQAELIAMSEQGIVNVYNAENGFLKWQSVQLPNADVSWSFDGINLIDGLLWVAFSSGDIYQLNVETGAIVSTYLNTPYKHITTDGNNVFAYEQGIGVVRLNPSTLETRFLVYPTTEDFDYIKVSEGGRYLLIAKRAHANLLEPLLVSPTDSFNPVTLNTLIYDAYMHEDSKLILSTRHGVQSYNLESFNDTIFISGFE